MKFVGVIGSREYPENARSVFHRKVIKEAMFSDGTIDDEIVLVSGGCDGSPDLWAESIAAIMDWECVVHYPRVNSRLGFFERNGLIAEDSDVLIAFIPRGKVKSGAWNTVSQFLDLGKIDVVVYDEDGEPWMQDWALEKLAKNQAKILEEEWNQMLLVE